MNYNRINGMITKQNEKKIREQSQEDFRDKCRSAGQTGRTHIFVSLQRKFNHESNEEMIFRINIKSCISICCVFP